MCCICRERNAQLFMLPDRELKERKGQLAGDQLAIAHALFSSEFPMHAYLILHNFAYISRSFALSGWCWDSETWVNQKARWWNEEIKYSSRLHWRPSNFWIRHEWFQSWPNLCNRWGTSSNLLEPDVGLGFWRQTRFLVSLSLFFIF